MKSKQEFTNEMDRITNEDHSHTTQFYTITKEPNKKKDVIHLSDSLKNMSDYYSYSCGEQDTYRVFLAKMFMNEEDLNELFEEDSDEFLPNWRSWQFLYKNIIVDIVINYLYDDETSIMRLKYIEDEINKTDIEEIINTLSFLEPVYDYESKSLTRQEIDNERIKDLEKYEKYRQKILEEEQKRSQEMIEKEEKRREYIKNRQIIPNNWSDFVRGQQN